jgi:hypothetical protein
VRVRLPDPALRADLRDFFHRWGCVTYEVNDGALEVIVPDAPGERQGAASSTFTSRPGGETTRASSWSSSTDPSESRLSQWTPLARPHRRTSLYAQTRSCLEG